MARHVGDRVAEAMGKAFGTIIWVKEAPEVFGGFEYGIAWDDGKHAGKTWTEADLWVLDEVL